MSDESVPSVNQSTSLPVVTRQWLAKLALVSVEPWGVGRYMELQGQWGMGLSLIHI